MDSTFCAYTPLEGNALELSIGSLLILRGSCALTKRGGGVPIVAQWVKNQINIPEDADLMPGLDQWVKNLVCYELWCRLQMQLRSHVAVAVV